MVTAHGINRGKPWHRSWSLRCSPPGGTHMDAKAACAALADFVNSDTVPPRHCTYEGGAPWISVRGTYAGDPLSLTYAEACASGVHASRRAMALGVTYVHG